MPETDLRFWDVQNGLFNFVAEPHSRAVNSEL